MNIMLFTLIQLNGDGIFVTHKWCNEHKNINDVIKHVRVKRKLFVYDVNVVDQNSNVLSTAIVGECVVIFDYLTYDLYFYYILLYVISGLIIQ